VKTDIQGIQLPQRPLDRSEEEADYSDDEFGTPNPKQGKSPVKKLPKVDKGSEQTRNPPGHSLFSIFAVDDRAPDGEKAELLRARNELARSKLEKEHFQRLLTDSEEQRHLGSKKATTYETDNILLKLQNMSLIRHYLAG
jgi:hypothetical protein